MIVHTKGCLEEEEALRFAMYLGIAIHHIHKNGIVHRDIKVSGYCEHARVVVSQPMLCLQPENVMLTALPSGKLIAKLGDFGLSQFFAPTTTRAQCMLDRCHPAFYRALMPRLHLSLVLYGIVSVPCLQYRCLLLADGTDGYMGTRVALTYTHTHTRCTCGGCSARGSSGSQCG